MPLLLILRSVGPLVTSYCTFCCAITSHCTIYCAILLIAQSSVPLLFIALSTVPLLFIARSTVPLFLIARSVVPRRTSVRRLSKTDIVSKHDDAGTKLELLRPTYPCHRERSWPDRKQRHLGPSGVCSPDLWPVDLHPACLPNPSYARGASSSRIHPCRSHHRVGRREVKGEVVGPTRSSRGRGEGGKDGPSHDA